MIVLFLILTFFISWSAWFFMPIAYGDFVMFVPGMTAVALTLYKKEKLKILFRVTSIYNLIKGCLVSLIAFALYLMIAFMFEAQTFGFPNAIGSRFFLSFMPFVFAINLFFACGEEIGWRGYLLRKVKSKLQYFWLRGLMVGMIWGIWHLPIYILEKTSPENILIFLINVCLISICYTQLYEHGDSIWPVVLAHGTHNLFFNTVLPMITFSRSGSYLLQGEEGLITTMCYALIIFLYKLLQYYAHQDL